MATQKELLLDYMRRHDGITSLEASRDLGIQRLSARIFDLRADGIVIRSERCQSKNRYGRTVCYDRYKVVEE